MQPGRATFEIIKGLSPRSRVALGAIAVEHLLDLYRFGNMKYAVKDVSALTGVAADRDLIEFGLEQAWRYVIDGKHDAGVTQPIIEKLEGLPDVSDSKTLSVPASGVIFGIIDTLMAITDKTPDAGGYAVARSATGVSDLVQAFSEDEDAPAREQKVESAWQLKVATLVQKHGDKPIDRKMFDALLAEELPWREYLAAYRERWSGASPKAARAAASEPAPKKGAKAKKKK